MFVKRDGSEIQKCYRCAHLKPAEDFAWRRKHKGQRDAFCRRCRAAYKQEHYLANRQRYVDDARRRKERLAFERTSYLLEFFEDHPCSDCGETDPVVLEFDHVDSNKAFNIGAALTYRKWATILEEIHKCEVVCTNLPPSSDRVAARVG